MLKNLRRIVRPYTKPFALALASAICMDAVMTLLNPLLLKYIFDEGVIKKDFRLFMGVTVAFMVLATAFRLFSLWNGLFVQDLKNKTLKRLIGSMLGSYYRLPYLQVVKNTTGYYTSRVYDEPLAASSAAIDLSFSVSSAAVSFVVALGVIIFLSLKATLALALTVPFLVIISNRYRAAIKKHSRDEKEGEGELRGVLNVATESYRTVNIFGLQAAVLAQINGRFDKYIASLSGRIKSSAKHNTFATIFMSYGEMLVMMACGYAILKGDMSFGGFMAFMNAFWLAVGNMRTLVQKIPELSKNSIALQRLAEFSAEAVEDSAALAAEGTIKLEGVGFSYGDKKVFSDLSFRVSKGEKLLLSGKNGSGKSTVANILSGFLSPQNGKAETFGIAQTSACIAPHTFVPGSVKDNVGYDGLDQEQKGYLHRLVEDFSLAASLEKNPEELSAGQKKKVEVVMGLMKKAGLYLFDEPLANVDAESKGEIMRHIFERSKNSALIVIMHGDEEFHAQFDHLVALS